MILQVMAAYDKKARAFMNPFYTSHVDVGVRAFATAANTAGHQVRGNAEDFALYHLGTFNDEGAQFELFPQPKFVAEALQLQKPVTHNMTFNPEGIVSDDQRKNA